METAETVLLETLVLLRERELQRFKDKLSEIQPKEGYQHLPSGSLRNAAPPALTDLLLLFYGTDYGAEVAAEALRAIGQGALAERMETLIDALRPEKQKQHPFVGGGFMYWKCTLNDEQYQTIRAEKTSQEQMRKLYELVPGWNKWQKDRLYQALKETNRDLVEELEGGHFVDRHREQLIQRVSEVDGVLKLLQGHTLTPEQYQSISTGRSNVEKMQKLYELVPSWGREQKDRLYRVLCITNRALVDEFAGRSGHMDFPHDQIDFKELISRKALERRTGRGGLLPNWLYVLNDEQYQTIRAEKTSQEQMRKLYELVPSWGREHKDRLYWVLYITNVALVNEFAGVGTRAQKPSTSTSPGATQEHFVERHREQLIQRASSVDTILGVLRQSHHTLDAMPPSVGLETTNIHLFDMQSGACRGTGRELSVDSRDDPTTAGTSCLPPVHHASKRRSGSGGLLRNWLYTLNDEQYQTIRAEKTSQEQMRKLYELVPSWDEWHKDRLYQALKETNRDLVEELEGGHFVDRHREQLIQRVSEVDGVLKLLCGHTLTPEQYQSISTGRSNVEKMQKLYELVPSWGREHKDRLYGVLWITNRALVDESAGVGTRAQKPSTSTSPGAKREHFVERHREQLIQRASSVDTTLNVLKRSHYPLDAMPPSVGLETTNKSLRKKLKGAARRRGRELSVDRRDDPTTAGTSCLPPVQHDSMRNQGPVSYASKAHTVFPGEGSQVTGQAHHSLAPTGHSGHMEVLHDQISTEELTSASGFTSEETESHSSSAAGIKATGGETSRSQSPTACLRGQHKCNWCAREEEKDLPEEIKPEIIQDIDGNQEMYRVHFSRAGWFRCPETELEFKVRAAVTIRYGYGSWRQHLTESQQEQWMVAGPLFDIRVEPTEAVAAIHLPHFLCLRDADKSWMHIAHFIDEGMSLENPTQVKLFHAVLENPSFSLIGVFWRRESSDQRTPIHSIVLLYQAQKRVNLTLHLYLIPDDGSRVKAVEVYEEKCRSWFVSKSHFTSKPLCFGSRCIVSSPLEITVTPKELPFLDKPADALQPFTEIHTKDVKKELELSLVEKNDEKPIWEAVIRPEDLMPSVSSTKMRTDTHFVDQHREQLIQRVTAVDSILDSLHGPVLDTEQYQRVRAERTNPDKMRKLYELVPSWNSDCKDKFYQALKDKHSHLVEELSGNR